MCYVVLPSPHCLQVFELGPGCLPPPCYGLCRGLGGGRRREVLAFVMLELPMYIVVHVCCFPFEAVCHSSDLQLCSAFELRCAVPSLALLCLLCALYSSTCPSTWVTRKAGVPILRCVGVSFAPLLLSLVAVCSLVLLVLEARSIRFRLL